jgi:hypothetical protein
MAAAPKQGGVLPAPFQALTPLKSASKMGAAAPLTAQRIFAWSRGPTARPQLTVRQTAIRCWPENRCKSRQQPPTWTTIPFAYSWNASAGRVRGSGASGTFDTAGLPPGHYTVSVRVDDGRSGTADCRLAINVQEPPRIKELEKSLDLHSIYFPTAQPYTSHPNGGLVPSQQQILITLSQEFREYLGYKPEAHLVLGGHADHRGSEEYNKGLTERRVARTKSFLVEHGVPADHIETRSYGEDDSLNADQVKEQISENPDLSQNDRQQMLNNLNVMVLANNRRVDVSLTTTGQQSTRRYPFNAKDFLALIDTKGGEKKRE